MGRQTPRARAAKPASRRPLRVVRAPPPEAPRGRSAKSLKPKAPGRAPAETAAPLVPPGASLDELRAIAKTCRACPLWEHATQTVFGEGPRDARVVLVGETPGDREDLADHPFVGPAGRLLDDALEAAGLDRSRLYLTNAVKHFKFTLKGKRRLHEKPSAREIAACKPWVLAELAAIEPRLVVCLGATAAQALLGKDFRVTVQRGQLLETGVAGRALATVHPSSILRITDGEERRRELARFTAELKLIRPFLKAAK